MPNNPLGTDVDLFGVKITEPPVLPKGKEIPKGYAATPGSGPQGETCRSCKHYVSLKYHDKSYPKCLLRGKTVRHLAVGRLHVSWSHCYASDIRAKSPACKFWTMPNVIDWQREPSPVSV